MGVLGILLNTKSHAEERRARRYRELITKEAKMGGALFGPVPEGVRREFFCLDANTWIWHEEWTDANGQQHVVTTRYDVRPNGVLKAQDGQPYRFVEPEEAKHLYKAVRMYAYLAHTDLYAHAA
jgi:hypothetical protein